MRLAGDPDSCAALGRELARAATQTAVAGAHPERSLLVADLWSGVAAASWYRMTTSKSVRAQRLAEQLDLAARAVRDFADRLAELQVRAARLASAAAAEGLEMDADGGIPPVPLLFGPYTDLAALAEQQRALHRAEVRSRLIAEVAALRADEDELHARLVAGLRSIGTLGDVALHPAPAPDQLVEKKEERDEDSWWEPSWWDTSAAIGVLGTRPLSELALSGLRPAGKVWAVVRTAPGAALVTGVVGVRGDVQAGYDMESAVLKQTVVGASSVGAGVTAASVATAVLAPVAVPVVAGVVVGAAVGYGLGKAWDAVADPTPRQAAPRAPLPRPLPQVGPAVPRRLVVPVDPTCGRGPTISRAS